MYEVLNQTSTFTTLSFDQKKQILGAGITFFEVDSGEQIVKQNSQESYFYILVSGSAKVVSGDGEKSVAKLESGDFIGELAFFTNKPRIASVIAIQPCVLMRLDHSSMAALPFFIQDKIKDSVIEQLANRMSSMNTSTVGLMDDVAGLRQETADLKDDVERLISEYPHIQKRIERGDLTLKSNEENK